MLTLDGLTRIERLLGTVIEHPAEFSTFQVEFAHENLKRTARFGTGTLFTTRQHVVITKIEQRIAQLQRDEVQP